MGLFHPDRILIACNTLSIIYQSTEHSRAAAVPVLGIIDAGVELFYDALKSDPRSAIVLIGTRTTIESGVHRDNLVKKGISPRRITGIACPGLAAAIETNPSGPAVATLIDKCASEASAAGLAGDALYCGFCCTHYTYVGDQVRSALERASGKKVRTLDPKDQWMKSLGLPSAGPEREAGVPLVVEVISKVKLDENARRAIAERVEPVSSATAKALLSYTHMPDLF
jgi:glutamate racemase